MHQIESGYTAAEELAHAATHALGLIAALAGMPLLLSTAAARGPAAALGAAVFGATIVALYLSSTLYHALPPRTAKQVFHAIDHCAIYLLIAGTYTPFTLTVLRGAWGWSLLAAIWTLAATGIALKSSGRLRHVGWSNAFYLLMGWLALVAVWPLCRQLPTAGLAWLVAGGLLYTIGVPFYAAKRMPWAHVVWHLFVLGGTVCHYVAVLGYAA